MNRRQVVAAANRIRRAAELPDGARVVVVVTGEDGAWVGVSHNTGYGDCQAILHAAMCGGDLEFHGAPHFRAGGDARGFGRSRKGGTR